MERAARQNKQMPDAMVVGHIFPDEKINPDGITATAREQKQQRFGWQARHERPQRDHDKPAHDEVKRERDFCMPAQGRELKDEPDQRKAPDQAENKPAPKSFKPEQCDRRIGSCNEQVYAKMVDNLEDAFPAQLGHRMVQCRGGIQYRQAHAEHQ